MNRSFKLGWITQLAAALALGAGAPSRLAAAEAEDPMDEEIEVIRVVGVKMGELPKHPTSFASEIDLQRFEGEQRRLEDLLAQTVGVQLRRFGGAGDRAEISIRGFASSQVVVQLDGMTLNGGRGGGVDLAGIPLAQLESVSVTRGGSSVRAGSGAMGGVVELRTRRPDFPSRLVSVQGGSFGTYDVSVYRTQPGRVADLGFGYSGFTTDGDFEFARVGTLLNGVKVPPSTRSATRINNKHEQHNGNLSLGFDLSSMGYLLAQQSFSYSSRGEPGLERGVASAIAGQQRFAHQRILRSLSLLRWEEIELGLDGAALQASIHHRLEKSKFTDPQPSLGSGPIEDQFDDMSTALSLRPEWTGAGWAGDHRVSGEILLTRDAARERGDRLRERVGFALVLRDSLSIASRVVLEPGVRFDWSDESGSHLIPSLGVVVTARPWLHFKGNVNRSFRNPSFQDLYLPDRDSSVGNPDLDPESATNYDLGFELVFDTLFIFRNLRLAASVFRSEIDDSIVWLPVNQFKIRPENTGPSISEGVEISSRVSLGRYLDLFVNHTELRAKTKKGGFRLPGRADRETHLRLELGRSEVFKAVAEMQRTGSISLSDGGTYILPSRISWNASLAFELSRLGKRHGTDPELRRLWVHLAIDNISNIAIRDSLSFPQPGRSLRLGVSAQW